MPDQNAQQTDPHAALKDAPDAGVTPLHDEVAEKFKQENQAKLDEVENQVDNGPIQVTPAAPVQDQSAQSAAQVADVHTRPHEGNENA